MFNITSTHCLIGGSIAAPILVGMGLLLMFFADDAPPLLDWLFAPSSKAHDRLFHRRSRLPPGRVKRTWGVF